MKIYFISYGIWEFDGRLRELVKVASELGNVMYITKVKNDDVGTDENHIKIKGNNYFQFIAKSVREGLRLKDADILFVDNRKAVIPALLLNLFHRPRKIILDVRELYLVKEVKHLAGKIGCFFESIMIKKADIVICANKYRADIMRDYYKLDKTPLVYENLRKLDYSSKFAYKEFDRKYSYIFSKDSFKIISTSGYSISRTNDVLVDAIAKLGNDYELLLVGGGNDNDKVKIQNIIEKNSLTNVHLIEKLEEDELKYLISKSQIGVVNYHQEDMNNKYCASGKIYEFIFEGLPVVTTENVPLVEFCKEFQVGHSDNNYVEGIKKIINSYSEYKLRVENVRAFIDPEKNNKELVENIIKSINEAGS